MHSTATVARNEIEERHLKALTRFGHAPEDFAFEAQLSRLREHSPRWTDEGERALRRLETWSPSRFELIELIPFYEAADRAIRRMQAMSHDRWNLPRLDFLIASDPSQLVMASVDDNAELLNVEGAAAHVVWMHVGLINFNKAIANHCVWTLVRPRGTLERLVEDVARPDGPDLRSLVADLLARPFDQEAHLHADPFVQTLEGHAPDRGQSDRMHLEHFHDSDTEAHRALSLFLQGFTTFVAGHEIGHVYLGHTGSQPRIEVLRGQHGFDRRLGWEVEADVAGLTAVWDGMREEASASIDFTWLGPVAFLASMTGVHLAGNDLDEPSLDEASLESALIWRTRLAFVAHALMSFLVGNRFEPERVRRVGFAVPPVAAAITEWLRINGLPAGRAAYRLNGDVEAELRDICGHALARL